VPISKLILALLIALCGCLPYANAQDADSFKGKTISYYVGWSPGGGYDLYGRLVARHLGKHIPGNPTILVRNMAGAGSLTLANWLYNVAPKDGTAIGTVTRGAAFDSLFGTPGARYDATKFVWLGSANNEISVVATLRSSGIATLQDMLTKPLIVAGTSAASDDNIVFVINGVLGAQIRTVWGYPGGNDMTLAMERGEVQGRAAWSWSTLKSSRPDWLRDKFINIPTQVSLDKHPDLPDVPLIMDAAKTPEQQQILRLVLSRNILGRPTVAPPDLPPVIAGMLRKAFMDTMLDREFLAEANKMQLEITPVPGQDVQNVVLEAAKLPHEIIERTGALLKGP
jgi:tripartite-type tricarboxylate transporter receptor subunit TctC